MDKPGVQQLLQQAKSHHMAGRFDQAEPIYRRILAQDRDSADAMHFLGMLLCQTGRADLGLEMMRRSIELRPLSQYHSNLGEMLRQCGQIESAIECFRAAIALDWG